MIVLILPILIPNNYSTNKYMESYKENETYKYNMLIWLQNTENFVELLHIDNKIMKNIYSVIYQISLGYETSLNGENKYLEIKKVKLIKELENNL